MTQSPATQTRVGMSVAELLERGSNDERFEILDGEIVHMTPQAIGGSDFGGRLYFFLMQYLMQKPIGRVFVEGTFILPDKDDPNWVRGSRVPDVMFVSQERFDKLVEADPDWRARPLPIVPEIVAEVVSPTDKMSEVHHKVALYLADGVRLVWVIDPQNHVVNVHRPNSDTITQLGAADTLSAGALLPDFALRLATLFDLT